MEWWGGGGMVDLANWSRLRFVLASLQIQNFCFLKNRNIVVLERIRLKGNTIQYCI